MGPGQLQVRVAGARQARGRGPARGRADPQVDSSRVHGRVDAGAQLEPAPADTGRLDRVHRQTVPNRCYRARVVAFGQARVPAGVVAGQLEAHEPVVGRVDTLDVREKRHRRGVQAVEHNECLCAGLVQVGAVRPGEHRRPQRAHGTPPAAQHRRGPLHPGKVRGEQAEGVERLGHQEHAAGGDPPVRGLEADHAAVGGRPDHRAAGLGAQGERAEARGHCGRRAAGRPARGVSRVVRVAGRPGREQGELGGHRFGQHHRAGGAQQGHRRRLRPGQFRRRQVRARTGGQPVHVHDVLDPHRHPPERSGRGRGQLARDPRRPVRLGHKGLQAGVLVFDPGQVHGHRGLFPAAGHEHPSLPWP